MVASKSRPRDDPALRDAYLSRLGLEAEPPSVEALFRIHRRQVERVPYETLWIHLGEGWGIDPQLSMARIATTRRGGYCYQLNGALSELLASLGYAVHRHVGGVHGPDGPSESEMTNHLVLTVGDLPSEDNPSGVWYVDAGLGDALYEPLPLVPGSYHQAPLTLGLERTESAGDWHLSHDPTGSFSGMAWYSAAADMSAFEDRHEWLSTSAESGFVRFLVVERRDDRGADILRGLVLKRMGQGASTATLESKEELVDSLGDVFDLDLGGVPTDVVDTMWKKVYAAHLAWEEAGRPEGRPSPPRPDEASSGR